ncbi:putative transcription factor interactor and regulator LisH family [Arabidopsis thaliana]
MEENEEEEELRPTALYTVGGSDEFTFVSPDGLSGQYTGPDHDGVVLQTENPAPTNCLAYYFEVHIMNAGEKGEIAIGFSKEHIYSEGLCDLLLNLIVLAVRSGILQVNGRFALLDVFTFQYTVRSCAYIGNSGLICSQNGDGDRTVAKASDTYTTGDLVGCGIDSVSQEFFFTKNGTIVGTIPRQFRRPVYPTIVLHSQNEAVTVNFGGQIAFSFDFEHFEESLRVKKEREIEKISMSRSISHGLVKTYLLRYGYEDSFRAFNLAASRHTVIAQENSFDEYELHQRKKLRELIMTAEIDDAIAALKDRYPQLIEGGSEAYFLLICQKIVELVRKGAIAEAKSFGNQDFKDFRDSSLLKNLFDDCSALFECETIEESGAAYLLGETQKNIVAAAVSEAILSTNPATRDQQSASLERVLRQFEATCSLYARE